MSAVILWDGFLRHSPRICVYFAVHRRETGDKATIDVYDTSSRKIWTTIFTEELEKDRLVPTHYCGIRWGRWAYEVLAVGDVPWSSHRDKYTFTVTDAMKDWANCYQKNHERCSFNTLPPVPYITPDHFNLKPKSLSPKPKSLTPKTIIPNP